MMNQIKTAPEIEAIRQSGHMLATVLRYLVPHTVAGITTGELDDLAVAELRRLGGKPAFLGYEGYPKSILTSVNEEVVHGIPGKRTLADGDIIGIDFGVDYRGMITDSAITVPVGAVSDRAARLIAATERSMMAGIGAVRAGARIGDISAAVEGFLRPGKFGIVEDLAGHGVGHRVHEDPIIMNVGRAGTGMRLKAGMTIAIEPMVTLGTHEVVLGADGWTVSTADKSLAAHFEHTVLVTEDDFEVLTEAR